MKRGEIWTVSGGGPHVGKGYTGKPRPAVILQADQFDATGSITLCAFTTDPTEAPLFRLAIQPTTTNGLNTQSRLMIDKITTVAKSKIGTHLGHLTPTELTHLNRAIATFLGLG